MDLDLWPLVDALMAWVIIPIAAVLWVHNQKLAAHDREVLRIVSKHPPKAAVRQP